MEVLVTGGGGFLGSHVVRALLERGHRVRSFARGHYPELEAWGVATYQGDLAAGGRALEEALKGAEAIVHCAAKAGVHGPAQEFERANHQGTLRLLEAARASGVRKLVHTSSPSVCFDGRDHLQAGPDLPYAQRFLSPYPESKARAERAVLAAHDPKGLCTLALRPHLIFGPGDPHLIPRLLERARAGRLIQVGRGDNEVSLTFVENAAWAHV
ncbi:MAG TPA: NAD-dependent epimerase/dehydratase family protein, partial [Planctomycetota bacterium]|nr:NAD-dependent epimerase/dehydratase family protein [Planctomycetota bacterium]